METRNFEFGSNVACRVLLAIIVCTVVFRSDGVVSAQTGPQFFGERAIVVAKLKRFAEYQQDFLHFAESGSGSTPEYEVSTDLHTAASQTGDYLAAVQTLLEIYADLSCNEDRVRIRPVIERELGFYSKQIEPLIKQANLGIAHTTMPGVAAEGTRMRDDLRDVKSILDSITPR